VSTLAEAKAALADALSAVEGYDVRTAPFAGAGTPGDGWVVSRHLEVADLRSATVTLTAVILFSGDLALAEQKLTADGVALLDAASHAGDVADVALDAAEIMIGTVNPAPWYGVTITLTTEVTSA
jgi:hypothetical protein